MVTWATRTSQVCAGGGICERHRLSCLRPRRLACSSRRASWISVAASARRPRTWLGAGWRALGVDQSAQALSVAARDQPVARFARADVTKLPLRSGSAGLLIRGWRQVAIRRVELASDTRKMRAVLAILIRSEDGTFGELPHR